jgi:hypothetical protein
VIPCLVIHNIRDNFRIPKDFVGKSVSRRYWQCLFSAVDGTDVRIQEPTPFSSGWHSKKFNGPGLWYEIAISIRSGDAVWIHGPFPCGHWPDIKIFRDALINGLDEREKVEADKGYRGEPESVSVPNHNVFLNRFGRQQKELVQLAMKH